MVNMGKVKVECPECGAVDNVDESDFFNDVICKECGGTVKPEKDMIKSM